ncbi:hypothetical protein, partial [Bradyrhizobium sp. STM 3809]|uniref:hypothetical protein n=1 Tax=Bradyrhizobium sp. STM 3809 TaxID=551936 RepID=UPI000556193C
SESRFWRTDAERTIPDIFIPFWCETNARSLRDQGAAQASMLARASARHGEWQWLTIAEAVVAPAPFNCSERPEASADARRDREAAH